MIVKMFPHLRYFIIQNPTTQLFSANLVVLFQNLALFRLPGRLRLPDRLSLYIFWPHLLTGRHSLLGTRPLLATLHRLGQVGGHAARLGQLRALAHYGEGGGRPGQKGVEKVGDGGQEASQVPVEQVNVLAQLDTVADLATTPVELVGGDAAQLLLRP